MAHLPDEIQPKFILRNPTELNDNPNSIQLIRVRDNERFLASPMTKDKVKDPENPEWEVSLASVLLPEAGVPLSRILNHPNIISLIDIIHTDSLAGPSVTANISGNLIVYDDMNQGSLDLLLPDDRNYPPYTDFPAWRALATENPNRFSLPESLCWHVLTSINNALLWLHTGVKQTDGINDWQKHDDDWQPILIRDVSPKQIWFKRSTGVTTYGECKLAGFEKAVVTGFPGALTANTMRDTKAKRSRALYWAPEIYNSLEPWTPKSEIYSLGAVLYTMMTGIPPPRQYDYNWQVSRLNDKGFTNGLKDVVRDMLKHRSSERPSAAKLVSRIEDGWKKWRLTKDARGFVDKRDVRYGVEGELLGTGGEEGTEGIVGDN